MMMCNLYQEFFDVGTDQTRACLVECRDDLTLHRDMEICNTLCAEYLKCFESVETTTNNQLSGKPSPTGRNHNSNSRKNIFSAVAFSIVLLALLIISVCIACKCKRTKHSSRNQKRHAYISRDIEERYPDPITMTENHANPIVRPSVRSTTDQSLLTVGSILDEEFDWSAFTRASDAPAAPPPLSFRNSSHSSNSRNMNSNLDNSAVDLKQGCSMKVICSAESERLLTGILVDDDCDGGMPCNEASDDSKLGWSCLTEGSNYDSINKQSLTRWEDIPEHVLNQLKQMRDYHHMEMIPASEAGRILLEIIFTGDNIGQARRNINNCTGLQDHDYNLVLLEQESHRNNP